MSDLFNFIEGFGKNEKWGDPYRMSGFTVILLEKIRKIYRERYDPDASFVIHCGYETDGHTPNSWHYKGQAVDFHIRTRLSFVGQVNDIIEIINDLQVAQLIGLGIYPDWNNKGFHLDDRGRIARWGYIGNEMVSFKNTLKHAEEQEA